MLVAMFTPPESHHPPAHRRTRLIHGALALFGLGFAVACSGSTRQQAPAQAPPPGGGSPSAYPTPQTAPPSYPSYPGTPSHPPGSLPGQTGAPVAPTVPNAYGTDPIAAVQIAFLRQRAQHILQELTAALPPQYQQRVTNIPLLIDDTVGEVNAFAACSRTGQSAMAITDDMLRIAALLSQAHAHDEFFATQKVDEYIRLAAAQLRPEHPVPMPPSGFFPHGGDPRVVARQHQLFEEQVAFILGHELGHHYLNHLPCTAAPDPLGAGLAARVLADQVPLFNQPNEVAADLAGTHNLLNSGRQRATRGDYGWTEIGGLLSMRFFAGFSQLSPADLLLAFERSHPPPQLRTPIIQQAANTWRNTNGAPFPVLGF